MRRFGSILVVLLSCLTAGATAAAPTDVPPRNRAELLRWLGTGTYRATYTAEPGLRPSVPAHGMSVRVYYSPRLVDDLATARVPFRKGAAMVKELYFGGTDTVIGWAVMRKLRRRSGRTGRGWLFYESFNGTNDGALFGRGLGICTSCHAAGTDYLLSSFRP
jgi:hypothetical protein